MLATWPVSSPAVQTFDMSVNVLVVVNQLLCRESRWSTFLQSIKTNIPNNNRLIVEITVNQEPVRIGAWFVLGRD